MSDLHDMHQARCVLAVRTRCVVPLALAFAVVWLSTRLAASEAPAAVTTETAFDEAIAVARVLIETDIAPKTPGLSVAVGVDDRIVWSHASGWADIEAKRPVTATTRFRIGSISKSLTSVGVALLVERGFLDLDAPVQHYVPDFPAKPEGVITTRQLGGHLSGIRHYRGREPFSNVHHENIRAGLKIFEHEPLEAAPGTTFIYSTYGWCVISAVMESAARAEFTAFMEENVFTPLGMTHTRPDRAGAEDPERTSFYTNDEQGGLVAAPPVDCGYNVAGGGILSTPEDLLRFAAALWQPGLLQETSRQLLFTAQKTSDGRETEYGFGWYLGQSREGHPIYYHTGLSMGGTAILLLYPHTRTAIAMTSNHTQAPFTLGQAWRIVELISAAAAKTE